MSSREVARLTGKRHNNVLRDIRSLVGSIESSGENTAKFTYHVECIYSVGRGRPALQYVMTEGLTLLLLSSYRVSLIDRMALLVVADCHFKDVVYH